MARCAGIKRDGGRCATVVEPPLTHCYQHAPERAAERRRNASRAARARPNREIAAIKSLLADLVDRVLAEGDAEPLETPRATAANQLIQTRLRTIELERRIREIDQHEGRLDALEAALKLALREGDGDGRDSWAG